MNALFGAAALTSATVVKPAEAGQHPDAQLIDLGRRLDVIQQQYAAAVAVCEPLHARHREMLKCWRRDHPGYTSDQFMAAFDATYDQVGLAAIGRANKHPDDLMEECSPIAHAIMSIPATTLAGLAVKARLASYHAQHFWAESDQDADWDVLVARKLIEAVIQTAAQRC